MYLTVGCQTSGKKVWKKSSHFRKKRYGDLRKERQKKKKLNEKEGNWNSTVSYSFSGRRHWTTTCGCSVFPAFVHIHMGLLWHSQQMVRGNNVELHSGMSCHESSKMPIPNQKHSVRRGFVRGSALWKTNEWIWVQRKKEVFQVGVGSSF